MERIASKSMERIALREPPAEGTSPALDHGSKLVADAYEFARRAHADQRRRGDGAPFIHHPVAVAQLLARSDQPEEVIAAGLLHDVLEHCETSREEVEQRFGAEVARLVAALSENPGVGEYERRKAALREQVAEAGEGAAAIYVADKLSNLRDMRLAYERDGGAAAGRFPVPAQVRLRLWRGDLEMAESTVPALSFLHLLRSELDAFELPPEEA